MMGIVVRFAGIALPEAQRGNPIVRFKGFETVVSRHDYCCTSEVTNANGDVREITMGIRRQLPLALGWSTTIHKAEGNTFDSVQVDLATMFCSGQGYVALTRSAGQVFTENVAAARIFADPVSVAFYRANYVL
jgi:hypothetical protein